MAVDILPKDCIMFSPRLLAIAIALVAIQTPASAGGITYLGGPKTGIIGTAMPNNSMNAFASGVTPATRTSSGSTSVTRVRPGGIASRGI